MKSEKLAEAILEIEPGVEMIQEMHMLVSQSYSNGFDEDVTIGELFQTLRDGKNANLFANALRRKLRNQLRSGKGKDIRMEDFLDGKTAIYWPYSENWDGKTLPTIVVSPEDDREWTYGVKYGWDSDREENTRDSVVVNEDYAIKNPVWILRPIDYEKFDSYVGPLPDWGSINIIGKNNKTQLVTLYLTNITSKKQHDALWAGGSEYKFSIGQVSDFGIKDDGSWLPRSTRVSVVRVFRSRKDINDELTDTREYVICSDLPNEGANIAFHLVEEDPGGTTKDWEFKVSYKDIVTLSGSIPFGTKDDEIARKNYSARYIMSGNNRKRNTWRVDHSDDVSWSIAYEKGDVL